MKITRKGRYGLRVMIDLAENYGKGSVLAEAISERQKISDKYLHVLMLSLKTKGLIRTVRGPKGGYELSKPPKDITILEIISALEGELCEIECVNDLSFCKRVYSCTAREVWCEVDKKIEQTLRGITLKELLKKQDEKVASLAGANI